MLVLDTTTKSIVAAMSGSPATTQPDFTAAFADHAGSTFVEGANDGTFNGTSGVTIVPAPSASTRRLVKSITIENKDTAPITFTLSYDNNGTLRTIVNVTLQVGDTWTTNGTFNASGGLKQTTTFDSLNLATQVTGVLPVVNGGTGITAFGTGVANALGQNVSGSGNIALTTSPSFTTPELGIVTSGQLGNCTVDGTDSVGFRNTPVNSQAGAYELVLTDSGKTILHPATDNNARTFTIPANGNVAFPIGTAVTFVNLVNTVTISITTDTMILAGTGTTGNRTLAANGVATCLKVTETTWIITGNGVT
jgi:hypothetical protein